MTRLALASLGTGWTLGVLTAALTGQNASLSIGFSAGVGSAGIILGLACLLIWRLLPRPLDTPPDERRSVEL